MAAAARRAARGSGGVGAANVFELHDVEARRGRRSASSLGGGAGLLRTQLFWSLRTGVCQWGWSEAAGRGGGGGHEGHQEQRRRGG
eukprot:SAG31_NODE_3288_length_4459_cov_30.078440_4_plen_85_part_01